MDEKFPTLVGHFMELSMDTSFTPKAREEAERLEQILTDQNFLALLMFEKDVLSLVAAQSLKYQKSGGTHIGEYQKQASFRKSLKLLKGKKGTKLYHFLQECRCTSDKNEMSQYIESKGTQDIPRCKNLQTYETKPFKAYKLKELATMTHYYGKISSYIKEYVDELLRLHDKYFMEESVVMLLFEIFAPLGWKKKMPTNQAMDVQKLGKILGIENYQELSVEWPKFRNGVINTTLFCANLNNIKKNPEEFWASLLNSNIIRVPDVIQKLIQHILVIPTGSSDAERCFSIMNGVRGEKRQNLLPKNVEHLVRIKMNGPPMEQVNILHYAKIWVEQHKFTDGIPQVKNRKRLHTNQFSTGNQGIYYSNSIIY